MEKNVTILNQEGLHARPAASLVQEANKYQSDIKIIAGSQEVSAKSIMGIMAMGLQKDAQITIKADGEDATNAVNSIVNLINNQFNIEY